MITPTHYIKSAETISMKFIKITYIQTVKANSDTNLLPPIYVLFTCLLNPGILI